MNKKLKELAIKKYKNVPQFDNHKFPTSRRDFIKLGLLCGGGFVVSSLFPKNLFAATTSRPTIPFLTFDLAGGASLPGNFLVGKAGGPEDLAKEYMLNGWDPRLGGALDKTFGIPMSARESGILRGLKEVLPQEIQLPGQNYFKMASHLHFALDDTSTNRTSTITYISKAGLQGSVTTNGLGQQSSLSGGNSRALLEDSSYKPQVISNLNDILKLTSLGELFDSLSEDDKNVFVEQLLSEASPDLKNSYQELLRFGQSHTQGDPTNNELIRSIYPMNSERDRVEAAIVLNVIKGYTGPGSITIEGCDYHNGNRTDGDEKDLEIGRSIGRAVRFVHENGTPLSFQIITDGGMTADSFARNWQGDTPLRSMTILGHYDPQQNVQQAKLQIGHVTENSEVNITNQISSTPEKAAQSTLFNYLSINGMLGEIESIFGRVNSDELEQMIIFG